MPLCLTHTRAIQHGSYQQLLCAFEACRAEHAGFAGHQHRRVFAELQANMIGSGAMSFDTAGRRGPIVCQHLFCCVQSRPAWASYRASLERNNYFQGNIEGSERHRELLDQAVRAFLDSASTEGTSIEHAGARMLQLAQQPPDRAAIEKVS